MPDEFVTSQTAHRLAVLHDARDHRHPFLGILLQAGIAAIEVRRGDRHAVEFAEPGAELHQHSVFDALPREAQHQVLAPCLGDAIEHALGNRLGQVDPVHVCAQGASGRLNPDFAHGFLHTDPQFAMKPSRPASNPLAYRSRMENMSSRRATRASWPTVAGETAWLAWLVALAALLAMTAAGSAEARTAKIALVVSGDEQMQAELKELIERFEKDQPLS